MVFIIDDLFKNCRCVVEERKRGSVVANIGSVS